MSSQARSICEL